ncbi:Anoctamin-7 [Entomortierella beljakovae]|nr:Anoctamin-7 [Entomortierella beljakovae]
MQNLDRDESTVIDLASLGQSNRRQQQRNNNSNSPDTPNIFNHLSPLDSPSVAAPSNNNNNNNNNNRQSRQHNNKAGEKIECPRHATDHPPNRLTTRELQSKRTIFLFFGSDVVLFDSIVTYKLGNPDRGVDDAIDTFSNAIFVLLHSEHQGADALANIIYGTQAFDMVFKYPIPDHLRKVPDEPPVIQLGPTLSDINLGTNGSNNGSNTQVNEAEKEKEELKRRQLEEEELERQRQLELIRASAVGIPDIESGLDPKIEKDEKMQRHRLRFKKALLRESLIIEEEVDVDGDEMFIKVYAPFWRLCIEAQRMRYKMELSHYQTHDEKTAAEKAAELAKSQSWISKQLWRIFYKADNISLPLRDESLLFKANKFRQYALAEKTRKWSDIVRHGGGIKPNGSSVGSSLGSDGKDGFFGTARRGRLAESIIIYCKVHTKKGDRHAYKAAVDRKAFTDMFTLHDGSYKSKVLPIPNRRTLLYTNWVRSPTSQPIEEIRYYYGEKIALYFAWIGYYTRWLIPAAIVGFLYFIYGIANFLVHDDPNAGEFASKAQRIFDNALTLPFTLFMAVWSSLFVEFWKRKSNVLAYQWNTLDYERNERARPEFKPTGTRISPVTGKKELYYPRYKQIISILISIFVVLISIAIVIISVGSLILFNLYLKTREKNDVDNGGVAKNPYQITVLTAILNLVVIMVLGTIYAKLAKILTDNENHRRATQHEDALIIKRFLFDFINFYSTLFYIAYFKDSISSTIAGLNIAGLEGVKDSCAGESCMGELTIQLAIVFVGKQFVNQFQELAVPKLHEYWNRKSELAAKANLKGKYQDKKNMKKPPQWVKDSLLPNYDPTMFEDYRELVIQFGFCTLFVIAFPIAPIFAFLNNLLEIRVDAYKLLTQHRRPVAQPVQDIGSWSSILMLMTHISVFTNAFLIAFQSSWMEKNVFEKIPWVATHPVSGPNEINFALLAVRLLFVFIFEHLVFFLKVTIANFVGDVPRTVKLAIERENYYARLALDDEEPAIDEVLGDLDDETDESEDEEDIRKKLLGMVDDVFDDKDGDGIDDTNAIEDEEDDAELEALIKAGGCGCAAHGDGAIGTVKGGFDATWMSRFKPDSTKAALRRRQQRRRKKTAVA